MPRTVVPPSPRRAAARERERDGANGDQPDVGGGDSLPEKLVKYVPAETLAFFVPAAAAIGGDRDTLLIIVVVVAAVGTLGYLWLSSPSDNATERPLVHYYVLAVIAFLCWAVATSPNVADLIKADSTVAGLVLLGAVFLIPLADGVLNRLQGRPPR